jgi:hypothetical protein
LDPNDAKLLKAIAKFDTKATEVKNAKRRLRANFFAKIKNNLKHFRLITALSNVRNTLTNKLENALGVTSEETFAVGLDDLIGDELGPKYEKKSFTISDTMLKLLISTAITSVVMIIIFFAA